MGRGRPNLESTDILSNLRIPRSSHSENIYLCDTLDQTEVEAAAEADKIYNV